MQKQVHIRYSLTNHKSKTEKTLNTATFTVNSLYAVP